MKDLQEKIIKYAKKEGHSQTYKKDDEIIFPLFFRTLKEISIPLFHTFSINSIIEKCIWSRIEHSSEPYFVNISYWPKDTGLAKGTNFGLLFYSRIINLYLGKKPKDNMIKMLDSISSGMVQNMQSYIRWSDFNYSKSQGQEILMALEIMKESTKQKVFHPKAINNYEMFKNDNIHGIKDINFVTPTQIGIYEKIF